MTRIGPPAAEVLAELVASPGAATVALAMLKRCGTRGCKRRATWRGRYARIVLCDECAPRTFRGYERTCEPIEGSESIRRLEALAAMRPAYA